MKWASSKTSRGYPRKQPIRSVAPLAGATVLTILPLQSSAQPAPNARPVGGVVSAGVATIGRTESKTTIDQASQRAAIDWRSFNVGSQQSVQFNQPSTSAIALNRVVGPDPSQIAGRIDANGQIILVNQSGVTFFRGAQVNTSGLMVTAAGIGNGAFMAGSTKFDQPALPNARVVNQGIITIGNAGLAALVAPGVANSGPVTARLGHVVLAGARTGPDWERAGGGGAGPRRRTRSSAGSGAGAGCTPCAPGGRGSRSHFSRRSRNSRRSPLPWGRTGGVRRMPGGTPGPVAVSGSGG